MSGPSPTRVPVILCAGSILIDKLHFLPAGTVRFQPGGNAVIFGAVAARMGIHTAVAGIVGDDEHGDSIRAVLDSHGVDTTALRTSAGKATKVAESLVQPDGRWEYTSSLPRHSAYISNAFAVPENSPYTHLHVAGLNAMLRSNSCEAQSLIRSCRARGLSISLGLSRFTADEDSTLRKEVIPTDLLLCNTDEFCQLLRSPLDHGRGVADILRASRFLYVAVTLGANGALVKWNGRECYHVMPPKSTVRNTLGAGDVFAAALVFALLSGYPVQRAARLACAAGSLSVQHDTWMSWMSDRSDLLALVAEYAEACEVKTLSQGSP